MREGEGERLIRSLEGLEPHDAERAAEILAGCSIVSVPAGEPYFRSSFDGAALVLVVEGFTVLRLARADLRRSLITCEAGPGSVLRPPGEEEVLFGLADSRLIAIPDAALDRLLRLPSAARTLLDQLAETLGQKQEAIGNFANRRHVATSFNTCGRARRLGACARARPTALAPRSAP